MRNSPTSTPTDAPAKRAMTFDLSQMEPWREFAVVLHNDEIHSQQEVVEQIVKALRCSWQRAYALMRRAEENGRATVAIANRRKALEIRGVLKQIQLHVVLRQIN